MQSIENDSSTKQSSIKQEQNKQLPHSWKQIAVTLIKNRRNTAEKHRLGKMRQFYRLKIVNLIDQLKMKKIVVQDIDILNIDQIQNQIQQKQSIIESKIAKNQQLKKNIISIVQTLNESKDNIVKKKKNLQAVVLSNNRNKTIDDYLRFTFEQIRQIRENISNTNQIMNTKIDDLRRMESQIQLLKQNYLKLDKEVQLTKGVNLHLTDQLILHKQHYIASTRKKLSNQRQMIECLFQIGILIQQNYVFERVQKCLQLQQKAQVIKIQKNLSDRRLIINYQQDTLGFLLITSIYMHCKSLIITNIVNTMQRLSYYSEEFKNIYDFQLFRRYCKIFIEKEKFNSQWVNIKNQLIANDFGNQCNKIIHVVIEQKVKNQVLEYMKIYENSNEDFSLKISSNLTMIIKIFSLECYLSQKARQQKNVNEQWNVLHIKFKEKISSLEAQQLNDNLYI